MPTSAQTIYDGRGDLRRAAEELAERVPERLAPLARIAYNYRWSWAAAGHELFASIDRERFELCLHNPVRLLQEASPRALRRAAASHDLVTAAEELEAQIQADLDRAPAGSIPPERPVAFLCAEYGIHVSLPIYSGGLGALAGDLLKEASDQALPMVAVGLMYRKGYFRQRIDASGWQHEYWVDTDPQRLPAARVTVEDGVPLALEVPIGDTEVMVNIWRVDVGRVPLFLLDTDIARNATIDRWITARLYEGDQQTRLAQYVLLGVGGVRALRAMGIEPGVIHLNEGHAALAPVELARTELGRGQPFEEALAAVRKRTAFTTHTPVAAGNDSYPQEQARAAIAPIAAALKIDPEAVIALGRTNPGDEGQPFGVTQAALRMSHTANGVSHRHGQVAREMWRALWPELAVDEVPIGHVTNGIHIPTWIGPAMRELLDRWLGEGWMTRAADPATWEGIAAIPDRELWAARNRQRASLVQFVRQRSVSDRLVRGDMRAYVEAALRAFDPDVLTIGFARRVATYKRLELLTRDPEFTVSLLAGDQHVQVVLAGKAHPRDEEAKRSLQRLFLLKSAEVVGQRVVFLDDYDLASAAWLVRGCDVWLNLPRPPLEASGTSGMKSAVNGGLQLSVLDGWWAEAYDGTNGWALPGEEIPDPEVQDARDTETLQLLLREQVLPSFYDRSADGIPHGWLSLIRNSLRSIGPRFAASRMLEEYAAGPYAVWPSA